MARHNLTRFVILGLIDAEPMTGYDINKFIKETIADFWNESYGNLYPTLKRLVDEGLAVSQVEGTPGGRPDRIVYRITERGKAVLVAWLQEPVMPPKVRNEFLLKLFFGANVPAAVNRRQIEDYRGRLNAELVNYRALTDHYKETLSRSRQDQLGLLTLRQGTLVLEARIKWCDEALKVLSEYEEKGDSN